MRALSLALRRDLARFQAVKVNNFFLFVALLIYGALESGVRPASAYPFLLLLGLLLLFPLSSDPLSKIPQDRLASWPLGAGQRFALRLASLALSPVLWITVYLMLRTSASLALFFVALAVVAQACILAAGRIAARAPRWNPWRRIPAIPGRLGELVRKNLRQMLSVLDTYIALLLSVGGTLYRFLTPHADAAAFPIFAILVALALSTIAQSLFGLDSAAGATRYGLLPLARRQILLAKDIAFLGVLVVLVLPLSLLPGLTFGLVALAIGHFPSVRLHLPQQRWRFASGRVIFGAAQIVVGIALAFAEYQTGPGILLVAAAAYAASLYFAPR